MIKTIHGFSLEAIYDAAYLARLEVTFETFRRAPVATLKAVGQYDAIDIMRAGYRPLLPAQVLQRRERDREWMANDTTLPTTCAVIASLPTSGTTNI